MFNILCTYECFADVKIILETYNGKKSGLNYPLTTCEDDEGAALAARKLFLKVTHRAVGVIYRFSHVIASKCKYLLL